MKSSGFELHIAAVTHPGEKRARNEDCVVVDDWSSQGSLQQPRCFVKTLDHPCCLLVSDGLGGHQAGEVASRFVATNLESWVHYQGEINKDLLEKKIKTINRELFEYSLTPKNRGMGSTLAGVIVTRDLLFLISVGDSPIFQENSGFLSLLNTIDSPESGYGDQDKLPKQGVITQCIGGTNHFVEIVPHIRDKRICPGNLFLITTDGLTAALKLEEIETLLSDNVEETALILLHAALEAGAPDNLSFILVRVIEK